MLTSKEQRPAYVPLLQKERQTQLFIFASIYDNITPLHFQSQIRSNQEAKMCEVLSPTKLRVATFSSSPIPRCCSVFAIGRGGLCQIMQRMSFPLSLQVINKTFYSGKFTVVTSCIIQREVKKLNFKPSDFTVKQELQ